MNPYKYFVSAELINNPLCGIGTYKDMLSLETGAITREIKKLVLTGEENWNYSSSSMVYWVGNVPSDYDNTLISQITTVCSHYICIPNNTGFSGMVNGNLRLYAKDVSPTAHELYIKDENYTTTEDFKSYLAAQYAAGKPVTIWYVLSTSETDQITVPSGLSGNVEGYLIQDGTPTSEAPIYPTANTAKGWYTINAYKRSVLVWNTDTGYERSDGSWT